MIYATCATTTTIGILAASTLVATALWRRSSCSVVYDDGVPVIVKPNTTIAVSALRNFRPYVAWREALSNGLLATQADTVLHSITVRDAYKFGSRIGFLFLDAHVTMNGVRLPGAVFLRGPSVAVLLWYSDDDGNVFVVMVRQPRVATGRMMWEVPAGMIDADGDVTGTMFQEIREETSLTVNVSNLVHHSDTKPYTSCGILDERMELFSMKIDPSILKTRNLALCGNTYEGEVISKVDAICVNDPRVADDAKFHMLMSVLDPE